MYDKIIVLDFGSQYNQLIARRIRDMHVYSELLNHNISASDIKKMDNVKGIVFSGGPKSVYDLDSFDVDKEIFNLGIPVLGICYGMQLISKKFNGVIKKGTIKRLLNYLTKGNKIKLSIVSISSGAYSLRLSGVLV